MKRPETKVDRYVNIHDELKQLRQWVYCKLVPKENGKTNKIPFTPMTDKEAGSTWPDSWGTFDMAVESVKEDPENRALAFILCDDYVVIDLDMEECVHPITHEMNKLASDIVTTANSYTELSNSGKGLHIVMKGSKPGNACKNVALDIEIYSGKRVMVFTGNKLKSAPYEISNDQDVIDTLYNDYWKQCEEEDAPQDSPLSEFPDDKVLSLLKNDKKAWSWWNTEIKKGDDQSSVDMKLMMKLAFYSRKKSEQCERLFGQSKLGKRKKWIDRKDYRHRTINRAFAKVRSVYGGIEGDEQIEFPDMTQRGNPKNTIPNMEALLHVLGYEVKYNVICKNIEIENTNYDFSSLDGGNNASLAQIISDCSKYNMPKENAAEFVKAISYTNSYNPVKDWITSVKWDGKDWISELCDTIETRKDFPIEFKVTLLTKWLISGVAMALNDDGRDFCKGVLTIQGEQNTNKTRWFSSLVPVENSEWIKDGVHLDPSNKDSIKGAIIHWLVELGELDSTFKKDVERLKAFFTNRKDTLRLPYDRIESTFPRRTIFYASVNPEQFLKDDTGNVRFWTIPIINMNADHNVNMQQVWAQAYSKYKAKEIWYLTEAENRKLAKWNERSRTLSPIEEKFYSVLPPVIDTDPKDCVLFSGGEILKFLQIQNPHKGDLNTICRLLREEFGESKRDGKVQKWSIPRNIAETFHSLQYSTHSKAV